MTKQIIVFFFRPDVAPIGFIVFISAGVETAYLFILRPSGTLSQPWEPHRGDGINKQTMKCNGTLANKQIQFRIKPRRGDRKTPQHKKSHPFASCIAKFPIFTASKSFAKTNFKNSKI